MPREFSRASRVADQVQRELSVLVSDLTRGAKLGLVTITEVQVSPDLSHANVFVSAVGGDPLAAVRVLHEHAGQLRHSLGQVMRLKKGAPQLHFRYDAVLANAERLNTLIHKAVAEDIQHHIDEK